MSNSYYEVVELANGDIALQRVDGEGEPLVKIKFSPEVQYYLEEHCIDVAKVMINSGIQAVGMIQQDDAQGRAVEPEEVEEALDELEAMAEFELEETFDDELLENEKTEKVAPTLH